MIKQLEKQIRDLQKELTEVRKGRTALRLQPCLGDSAIREKDGKLEELDRRAKTIRENIDGLGRKRQRILTESNLKDNSGS